MTRINYKYVLESSSMAVSLFLPRYTRTLLPLLSSRSIPYHIRYHIRPSSTSTMPTSTSPHSRPLLPGVHVPTLCFFHPGTEDLDTDTIASHAVRLAKAGVAGLATQGSNGEAVHLTHDERRVVTETTRAALDTAGFPHVPVIVGCGAQSTRESILLANEAKAAGGDYALVLPPCYYAPLFKPNAETLVQYFTDVADASPIPIVIYNYPGAVSGIDLSSDVITKLAQHPNVAGVKLTCGNTGKLNRIASATSSSSEPLKLSLTTEPEFLVLAGSADFAVPALAAGAHGMLAGLANIAPRACVRLVELWAKGAFAEARELQDVVARGDWVVIQGGLVGTRAGLRALAGYGGESRRPLPELDEAQLKKWEGAYQEIWTLEQSLSS
jgi:4-hydroxy-2-oxoglutarate aldolase